jgi:hypothetical protein
MAVISKGSRRGHNTGRCSPQTTALVRTEDSSIEVSGAVQKPVDSPSLGQLILIRTRDVQRTGATHASNSMDR